MVVHFRTDKSKRIEIEGPNKNYLDQIENPRIAPVIYQDENEQLQKRFFSKNGYFLAKNLFNKSDVSVLEKEFDKIVSQLKQSGENINARWGGEVAKKTDLENSKVLHTHNVQSFSSIMLDMVQDKNLLNLVETFIGPDIILHHTKLFLKPPLIGSTFPLHQDWSYFPTQNNTMIAAIVHISDSTEEMGCFRLVAGSNKLGGSKTLMDIRS